MGSLEDKVAIVTGAAGGIGTAIALALAEESARIAVCDLASRRDDGLAPLVNAISDKGGEAIAMGVAFEAGSDRSGRRRVVGDHDRGCPALTCRGELVLNEGSALRIAPSGLECREPSRARSLPDVSVEVGESACGLVRGGLPRARRRGESRSRASLR